ncbi:bacteriocin immunity protein [uncultured Clostridium sp.]|uniref:bacteriocin immunity protein n=1 Tax=uncultured Clostridium sp. TaxID=59620 RepID=UPI002629A8B9|nr:bacteriocin immunity protein [uncultured Clostridium sp.]
MNKTEKCTMAKDIIHSLYNCFAKAKNNDLDDVQKVLLKAYKELDSSNITGLSLYIERIVKYLYWTAFTKKIHLTSEQENLIIQLNDIVNHGGLNGLYFNFWNKKPF